MIHLYRKLREHQAMRIRYLVGLLLLSVTLTMGCGDDSVSSTNDNPPGRLFVVNQFDATMYVYDTKTMTRVDSIDTKVKKPHYIEFAPDGANFYITTLETTGRIAKFNAATLEFVDSVSVSPSVQPSAIAITADSRFGYICNFSSPSQPTVITKYDLVSMQNVGTVQAGALTHDLKITSDGSVVIACNRNTDNITLVYTDADTVAFVDIDPAAGSPIGQPRYGPFGIVIDNRDSLAFIACMDALQVRVLDIASRAIVDSIDIPVDTTGFIYGPTLMAISPDNDVIYLTTRGGNSLVAFRVSTKQILANIPFSTPAPFGITISDDGSRIYVACVNLPTKQGRIYVIDGLTQTKIDSIDVGRESFGLIWRPLSTP